MQDILFFDLLPAHSQPKPTSWFEYMSVLLGCKVIPVAPGKNDRLLRTNFETGIESS
eukprot:m.140574 g.140574  ORF g.140574 m.140574 type:complete len:57 (+) comp38322_c0_seq3:297-467(+)